MTFLEFLEVAILCVFVSLDSFPVITGLSLYLHECMLHSLCFCAHIPMTINGFCPENSNFT